MSKKTHVLCLNTMQLYKFILEHIQLGLPVWNCSDHYECISVRYPLARQAKGVHVFLHVYCYIGHGPGCMYAHMATACQWPKVCLIQCNYSNLLTKSFRQCTEYTQGTVIIIVIKHVNYNNYYGNKNKHSLTHIKSNFWQLIIWPHLLIITLYTVYTDRLHHIH